jgi:hypothetical protein
MSKTLLLFIQSKTVDVYVNVLTHCVNEEGVREVFFVGRKEPVGEHAELMEFIGKIRNRITQLAQEHPEYVPARDQMPTTAQASNRVIRTVFVRPQDAIPELKKRFPDLDDLIVDVTGCKKRLASDVITAYVANGMNHVCHFQLSDRVFSSEWNKMGREKIYHDLIRGEATYYEYDDFSKPGTTISTLNRLRAQGRLIKFLIILSTILGFIVAFLISTQYTTLAGIFAIVLTLANGLGLLEDSWSLSERLRIRK